MSSRKTQRKVQKNFAKHNKKNNIINIINIIAGIVTIVIGVIQIIDISYKYGVSPYFLQYLQFILKIINMFRLF